MQTVLAKPATKPAELVGLVNAQGLAGAYLSTVVLTMTNPATIISFAAVFAGLGVGQHGGIFASRSPSRDNASARGVCGVCSMVAAAEQCR